MSQPSKEGEEIVTSARDFFLTYGTLLVLTLFAIGSSFIPLGVGNAIVVLGVALAKALLTLWIFMHVREGSRLLKMTIIAGIFTLGILFALTYSDYVSRAWGSW